MDPAREWTGRDATALRRALRLTVDGFARQTGVAPRTIANWASRPDMVPRAGVQDVLDGLLERAPEATRGRFAELTGAASPDLPGHAQALRVAIAVVLRGNQVLLVRRRSEAAGIAWQFPAGIIKPGERGEDVAVRETLGETGVHCSVGLLIGSRIHPATEVHCQYFGCEYLAGEAENRDTVENSGVVWAPRQDISRFVAREQIYPPVLSFLEEARDTTSR